MKFSIKKNVLVPALKISSFALDKTERPIMGCVFMQTTDDGSILLVSTNGVASITQWVTPIDIEEEGVTAVPLKDLLDWLTVSTADVVRFELAPSDKSRKNVFKVSTVKPKSSMSLSTFDASIFPLPPVPSDNMYWKVPAGQLQQALKRIMFSTGVNDEARPALNGINFNLKDEALVLYAGDGMRLSTSQLNVEGDREREFTVHKSLMQIVRDLPSKEGAYISCWETLDNADSHIVFRLVDSDTVIEVDALLIGDKFPDISRVFDALSQNTFLIDFDSKQFGSAIKQAAIFSDYILLDLDINSITVRAQNDAGASEVSLDAKVTGDADLRANVTLVKRFLSDILSSSSSDKICVSFGGSDRPIGIWFQDGSEKHIVVHVEIKG